MYKLYLDETGANTLTGIDPTMPHFAIGGTVVHKNSSEFIIKRGDQIRFKYWGHTDVTFRGTDMRGRNGDFSIFKDVYDPLTKVMVIDNSAAKAEFEANFQTYVEKSTFRFIWVGVNKLDWIKQNPGLLPALAKRKGGWLPVINGYEVKLSRQLYEEVLKIFIAYLKKKSPSETGQIVVEAATFNQDSYILAIYNDYLAKGIPEMGLTNVEVREILTCISFVTKKNRDSETQLADVGTHFLNIKARSDDKSSPRILTPFEDGLARAFKTKEFQDSRNTPPTTTSVRRL